MQALEGVGRKPGRLTTYVRDNDNIAIFINMPLTCDMWHLLLSISSYTISAQPQQGPRRARFPASQPSLN